MSADTIYEIVSLIEIEYKENLLNTILINVRTLIHKIRNYLQIHMFKLQVQKKEKLKGVIGVSQILLSINCYLISVFLKKRRYLLIRSETSFIEKIKKMLIIVLNILAGIKVQYLFHQLRNFCSFRRDPPLDFLARLRRFFIITCFSKDQTPMKNT